MRYFAVPLARNEHAVRTVSGAIFMKALFFHLVTMDCKTPLSHKPTFASLFGYSTLNAPPPPGRGYGRLQPP